MTAPVFLHYSQDELDRQYDQRVWAPNRDEVVARYAQASEAARAQLGPPGRFAYGPSPREMLDLYAAAPAGAPIHVFVHGGRWQLFSAAESAFAAPLFVKRGVHFVVPDFAPLPETDMAGLVGQLRRAIGWLWRNAAQFGGDAGRIYLSGHSSGAHLAACLLTTDWPAHGLPRDAIKGGVCASGIYDLQPVRRSWRSDYVRLTDDTEHEFSPLRHAHRLACPLALAYGGHESDEFKRQSRAFAAAASTEAFEAAGLNHFELGETLAEADGVMGRAALAQIGGVQRRMRM